MNYSLAVNVVEIETICFGWDSFITKWLITKKRIVDIQLVPTFRHYNIRFTRFAFYSFQVINFIWLLIARARGTIYTFNVILPNVYTFNGFRRINERKFQ